MKIQNWTPQSLAAELRKNIIGQDNYLDDLCLSVWLHSLRIQAGNATGRRIRQPKMNLLVLGPSGSGKTSAVQKLAELLEIPLLIEDASHFTGNGWKGRDVSSIVVDIMEMGSEDPYYTIVVLDEIDKMFLNTDGSSGFAAQNNLLRLMEGGIITHDEGTKSYSMETSGLLFICLGAFDGITDLVRKRLGASRRIGFGEDTGSGLSEEALLQQVTREDLKGYGLNQQFLGRIGLITATRKLDVPELETILTTSDGSILRQFDFLLSESMGTHLSITPAAIHEISQRAVEAGIGGRGLMTAVAEAIRPGLVAAAEDRSVDRITVDYANGRMETRFHHNTHNTAGKPEPQPQPDSSPMYTDEELRAYARLPIALFHYTYEEVIGYAQAALEEDMREETQPHLYHEVKAAAYLLAAVVMRIIRSEEKLSMGAVCRGLNQIAEPVRKQHEKEGNPYWQVFFADTALTLLGKAQEFQPDLFAAYRLACEVWKRKCKKLLQEEKGEQLYE